MEVFDRFARRYFDFKKGIQSFASQKDESVIDYWYNLVMEADIRCIDQDENYYYVNGFGQNVLVDFLDYDNNRIFEYVNSDPVLQKIWLKLGALICSYVLGSEIKRAI